MITSQLIATVLTFSLLFNQAQKDFYIHSWKKGKRTIQEQNLTIPLNSKQPEYRAMIKDSSGKGRYELTVAPTRRPVGEPGFEWQVEFKTKTKPLDYLLNDYRVNLLKPSNDPYQDYFTEVDYVWLFFVRNEDDLSLMDKAPYKPHLDLSSRRVVKIESFYVLMSVKSSTVNPKQPEAMDSMELCIEFTNKYPASSP